MRSLNRSLHAAAACLVTTLLLGCASIAPPRASSGAVWLGAWASSQQAPEPHNALDPADLSDATLRQIVRLSAGGARLRVRVSNAFGTAPLHIAGVHMARAIAPGSPRIDPATDTAVTFSGRSIVIVPAGADYVSDPVDFPVAAFSDLAITMRLDAPPAQQTSHPGSRTTSFLARGDLISAEDFPSAKAVVHWYFIAGVDVVAPGNAAAIVILGDSITDGRGSTTDGNDRWPDFLARRLQADPETRHLSILNHGIGGNRILDDGNGPNALARFDRDVLAQTGARYLIVLEGVNDLGTLARDGEASAADHDALVARLIGAYEQMIARAHAHGIRVYGATIMPYGGSTTYRATPAAEAARRAINEWIRTSGRFDAIIDFDLTLRDPERPDHLRAEFDSGDHLHPSPAGFRAMAEATPLALFLR